ncbi:MAG: hypothetical protein ABIQ07_01260, partial [Ginsengibacter sp.]
NSRSLNIRSTVAGNDPLLVPGAFANVMLDFAPNYTALMVPTQAIIPQTRGKKLVLYKNGIATFTDVTTGERDSSNVQILTGINAGDTIVTSGLMSVKPNAKVMIKSIIKPVQSVGYFKK